MAKKARSGRPQSGGRVTPKGVQPKGHGRRGNGDDGAAPRPDLGPARGGFAPSRTPGAPHVPTRAGHHRGQR